MELLRSFSYLFTVEAYVIYAVIAAAIVAFAARPASKGPVEEYLLAGDLQDADEAVPPEIEVHCLEDGNVRLVRRGIEGVAADGAVSLAVTKKGTDVFIEERVTVGRGPWEPCQEAGFVIKFLREGRYHVKYNSEKTGLFAAFPLHVTPGLRTVKILSR